MVIEKSHVIPSEGVGTYSKESKNLQFCNHSVLGFSSKYECKKLVFYMFFETMSEAIIAEKKLKKGSRIRKIKLIDSINPSWNNLYENIIT